jgi:hypothetical protein
MHVLLFWYPLFQFIIKFYVGSLNDANEAHKIEVNSLLFLVYNLEYYRKARSSPGERSPQGSQRALDIDLAADERRLGGAPIRQILGEGNRAS